MIRSSIRRTAVAAALSCLFHAGAVRAQSVIVVTGAREPVAADQVAGDVVVIDRATIAASTADSLADLLRREAGLQLSRNGGPGQTSGLLIRGASSGQTVLLVDGVRVGSATLGTPSLDGIALSQIDHIEVLRGPGSSLYGADAVGGVIQVFTRRGAGAAQLDASVGIGGYGSRSSSVGASGSTGRWDLAASAAHEGSVGVSALRPGDLYGNYNPDRDGYHLGSAQARIGWRPVDGQRIGLVLLRSRLDSQYDSSEYLAPNYTQDNTPNFRTALDSQVSALDWRGALASGWTGSARVSRDVDDSTSGGSVFEHYRTTRDHAGAQLAWTAGPLGQWIAAVEHSVERAATSSYLADVERRNTAFVLALDGKSGVASWQADLRRDDSSDFGGVTTGRLGGNVAFAPGWRLRALAGTTFRAPSFNDLYYPGYGVATLQPERGRSIEIGLDWQGAGRSAAVTVYRNLVRDLIGYEPDRSLCPADPAYDYGCARNTGRAALQGATLSAAQTLGAWQLRAQVDFLQARDRDTGARLPRRAAHQATLAADWTGGPWSAGASLLDVGARPDAGTALPAETTLDLKAGWRVAPHWQLQARLLNATNRDLQPASGYQGLGRQAWLLLRFDGALAAR